MPDIYASITAADPATLERLIGALELRAADLLRRGILNEVRLRDHPSQTSKGT
jgi:hypothetical protein